MAVCTCRHRSPAVRRTRAGRRRTPRRATTTSVPRSVSVTVTGILHARRAAYRVELQSRGCEQHSGIRHRCPDHPVRPGINFLTPTGRRRPSGRRHSRRMTLTQIRREESMHALRGTRTLLAGLALAASVAGLVPGSATGLAHSTEIGQYPSHSRVLLGRRLRPEPHVERYLDARRVRRRSVGHRHRSGRRLAARNDRQLRLQLGPRGHGHHCRDQEHRESVGRRHHLGRSSSTRTVRSATASR